MYPGVGNNRRVKKEGVYFLTHQRAVLLFTMNMCYFCKVYYFEKLTEENILLQVWTLSFPTLAPFPIPTYVSPPQPLNLHALTCVNMHSPTVRHCKMLTS